MGITVSSPSTSGSGISATGTYITIDQLKTEWGLENLKRWADKDSDGDTVKISAAIQAAVDWAERQIDDAFRDSIYTVPLSPVDGVVKGWAVVLVGAKLYRERGLRDEGADNQAGKLSANESLVLREMARYKAMVVRGPWNRSDTHPTAPVGG